MATPLEAPQTRTRSARRWWRVRDVPRFILLLILAIIFLAPLYWMLSTSFKPEAETISVPFVTTHRIN